LTKLDKLDRALTYVESEIILREIRRVNTTTSAEATSRKRSKDVNPRELLDAGIEQEAARAEGPGSRQNNPRAVSRHARDRRVVQQKRPERPVAQLALESIARRAESRPRSKGNDQRGTFDPPPESQAIVGLDKQRYN
jgi:hypothetical protein